MSGLAIPWYWYGCCQEMGGKGEQDEMRWMGETRPNGTGTTTVGRVAWCLISISAKLLKPGDEEAPVVGSCAQDEQSCQAGYLAQR